MIKDHAYTHRIEHDTWENTEAGLRIGKHALNTLQSIRPGEKKVLEKVAL